MRGAGGAAALGRVDDYYADQNHSHDGVASQLVRHLGDPRPVDRAVTRQLARYKRLDAKWHSWADVVTVCQQLAARMVEEP